MREYIVGCDTAAFVPPDWKIQEHYEGNFSLSDLEGIGFYFSESQSGEEGILGHELYKELLKKPALNACVLDYFLQDPEHNIPERLKEQMKRTRNGRTTCLVFWATLYYRFSPKDLRVRYLACTAEDGKWFWHWIWLDHECYANDPAAIVRGK
jgi:hypothetical protein